MARQKAREQDERERQTQRGEAEVSRLRAWLAAQPRNVQANIREEGYRKAQQMGLPNPPPMMVEGLVLAAIREAMKAADAAA